MHSHNLNTIYRATAVMGTSEILSIKSPHLLLLTLTLFLFSAVFINAAFASSDPIITTISGFNLPYGVAVNEVTDKIYVTNYGSNSVLVINANTDAITSYIPVGTNPYRLDVDESANRIYVANYNSGTISVINGATDTVITTIPVSAKPFGVAVNEVTKRVYVTHEGSNLLSVINSNTNTVITTITVGNRPFGVAVDEISNKVYVANLNSNSVSKINGATNTVEVTIPFDSAVDVAVNPNVNELYVSSFTGNSVGVFTTASNTFLRSISVGNAPQDIDVNTSSNRVYVANALADNIIVIKPDRTTLQATILTGDLPFGIAVKEDDDRVYVTNFNSHTVSVIEGNPPTDDTVYTFVQKCDTRTELCAPPNSRTIVTGNTLKMQYSVYTGICSSLRLHIFVDGHFITTTPFLSWKGSSGQFASLPLDTGILDLGTVSPGTHVLSLQGEGQISGCNVQGYLASWGGNVQIFTSSDATMPSMTVPSDMTQEATSPSGATVTYSVTAVDNVDGVIAPTCTPSSGSTFALGTTTVTCTATDAAGNTASATFTVTVRDTTSPSITAPATVSVISKVPVSVLLGTPTASDLVDTSLTITNDAPALFTIGTTIVTWRATDDSGNSASATQIVVVKTPGAATTDLIAFANSFGAQTSSLGQVSSLLNDNNPNNDVGACGKIDAFINQVNAKVGKGLTTEQANQLKAAANAIKASIGC